jgi:hypothetical protein
MNRALVLVGSLLLLAGLLWPVIRRLHLFRLPGDFVVERPGFKLFVPITTMILLSLAFTLLAWLLGRR